MFHSNFPLYLLMRSIFICDVRATPDHSLCDRAGLLWSTASISLTLVSLAGTGPPSSLWGDFFAAQGLSLSNSDRVYCILCLFALCLHIFLKRSNPQTVGFPDTQKIQPGLGKIHLSSELSNMSSFLKQSDVFHVLNKKNYRRIYFKDCLFI